MYYRPWWRGYGFLYKQPGAGKPNPIFGEQDILADLVEEAHKNGIKVIVRVDFRGVQRERYDRYPHWFALNADGTLFTQGV